MSRTRTHANATKLAGATAAACFVAALAASWSGCGPTVRCDEMRAAECPEGQTNVYQNDSFCEEKYEGECGGVWAEFVDCVIDSPSCNIISADGNEVTVVSNECNVFAYAECECAHEGAGSPWCP